MENYNALPGQVLKENTIKQYMDGMYDVPEELTEKEAEMFDIVVREMADTIGQWVAGERKSVAL